MILCRGDITKRREIAWSYTTRDAAPFIEHLKRDLMLREAMLGILRSFSAPSKEAIIDEYCKTCKRLRPGMDCASCSRKIEVMHVG